MRSLATWKLQKGTTIGLVEQLIGSNTISGAFCTQISLNSFNLLGLAIILIWSLSPLGSQASLRVISVESEHLSKTINLTAMDPFTEYYGSAAGLSAYYTPSRALFSTAMMSAGQLKRRSQDIWGNVKIPFINQTDSNETDAWIVFSDPNNITYSSLVGIPVSSIPKYGHTTFTMSTSYLSVDCPVFEVLHQPPRFTNYTVTDAPRPNGTTDCSWAADSSYMLSIAVSQPCGLALNSSTRDARMLVFETFDTNGLAHVECQLQTTYVDLNVSCSGASCTTTSARPSQDPLAKSRNWTVFDLDGGWVDTGGFVKTFTHMFPTLGMSGQMNPMVQYLGNPDNAITDDNVHSIYDIGRATFETRLTQLINTQLLVTISPSDVAGNFTLSEEKYIGYNTTSFIATNTTAHDVIRCNYAWLAVLVITSFACSSVAVAGSIFRLSTLVPDVLGTLSLAFLSNKCQDVAAGGSTLDGCTRATTLRDIRIRLGDIDPHADVGLIALAPLEDTVVAPVRRDRLYR
ncbi:hypothetical protein VTN00DRAFT_5430 [Thermoascus crustaceus]|uniref:uncharacterized protein n=1 Tax=Thermoascus crustaceus TaxID=5088 RepID=UPI00374380EE